MSSRFLLLKLCFLANKMFFNYKMCTNNRAFALGFNYSPRLLCHLSLPSDTYLLVFFLFHSFVVVLGGSLSINTANMYIYTYIIFLFTYIIHIYIFNVYIYTQEMSFSCCIQWVTICQAPSSLSITMNHHQRWRNLIRPQISDRNGLENGGS